MPKLAACAVAVLLVLIAAGPAAATTLPAAFDAACPVYGDMQVCSGVVPSFDGAKLDVDLTQPMQDTGTSHPLIVMLHGFGNDKHERESTTDEGDGADKYHWNSHWFAKHGYYVLSYTARGFSDQARTRTRASRPRRDDPSGSEDPAHRGFIQLKSRDYEIRDTQWLAALAAATYTDVDPNRVAVTGGSYGGIEKPLQASQAALDVPELAEDPSLPVLSLQGGGAEVRLPRRAAAVTVGHKRVREVGPGVLRHRDLELQDGQRGVLPVRELPPRRARLQPALAAAVRPAGHGDLLRVDVRERGGGQRGEVLAVADLDLLVLDADGAVGQRRTPTRGRRASAVGSARALVVETARGVGQDVEAVRGEPVAVPVVLVRTVTGVGRGLPLVLVVAEAVEHHHQRVLAAPAVARQGHVDVQRRAVEALDLRSTPCPRRPGTRRRTPPEASSRRRDRPR